MKNEYFIPKLLMPKNKYLFSVEKYSSENSELLTIRAIIAAKSSTKPLDDSSKNQRKGFDI